MELQKKWFTLGAGAAAATNDFLNFEKTFKPELEKKIAEHERLENQAEKMESKLTAAKVDFDQKKTVFFAGLREAEIKLRADARKEFEKLAAKGKANDIEEAVIAALEPKAKKITSLRSQALDILEVERDLARIRMEIGLLESTVFQHRQESTRNFLLKLFEIGGLSIPYKSSTFEMPAAKHWRDEIKRLDTRLAIAEGSLKNFEPVGLSAGTVDGLLEFSCYIPIQDFGQILEAWRSCKLAGATSAGIGYNQKRQVNWRFIKNRETEKRTMTQTADFSGGRTNRQRARA